MIALSNPMKWFSEGKPVPRRLRPPSDALAYYTSAANRGYLAHPEQIAEERFVLAQKYGYELPEITDSVLTPCAYNYRVDFNFSCNFRCSRKSRIRGRCFMVFILDGWSTLPTRASLNQRTRISRIITLRSCQENRTIVTLRLSEISASSYCLFIHSLYDQIIAKDLAWHISN